MIYRLLLSLVLLASVIVVLTVLAKFIFGFSFGVRQGDSNNFREFTQAQWATVLVIGLVVASASLVLLCF
jgi:hypothetical protein